MTETRDNPTGSDVAELYRAISVERTPQGLDAEVLRLASEHARTPRRWGGLVSWWPATALAAVVAVGIALVGEQLPMHDESDVDNGVAGDFNEAAADGATRIRELGGAEAALTPAGDPVSTYEQRVPTASSHCGEPATRTRAAWLTCIAELEAAGRTADAAEETERLENTYRDQSVDPARP